MLTCLVAGMGTITQVLFQCFFVIFLRMLKTRGNLARGSQTFAFKYIVSELINYIFEKQYSLNVPQNY